MASLGDCSEERTKRSSLRRAYCYLWRLSDAYFTHQCGLLACAVAYCALLSLVPLLIVGVAGLGFFMGSSSRALHDVIVSVRGYVPINPSFLRETLERVLQDRHVIGFFGLCGLLFAAHQAFLALIPAMNVIWVASETRHWITQRFIAVGATFLTLILLSADLAASAGIAIVSQRTIPHIPNHINALLAQVSLALVPLCIITLLFVALYQLLPDRPIPRKAAFLGAVIAALLWQVTKIGFAFSLVYFNNYDRLYGSLGSLVILVVWMYYSVAILLLGAEIAADYEFNRHGKRAAEARAHSGADLTAATHATGIHLSAEAFAEVEARHEPTASKSA